MKKSLEHLPKRKRDELERIAAILRDAADDVGMIILFGSYARGDYKEEADLDPERPSGHKSDYDILVVTKEQGTADDRSIWHEATKQCDQANLSTHVRIIAHDIQFVNIRLAEGHYFFRDIRREGRLLYDSGNLKLARKRKLKPAEQKRIAQDHFDHWFASARDFMIEFRNARARKNYRKAAFHLHQASEAAYKTILLVFTGYIPNEHYLALLGNMAAEHDAALRDIFPQETREQRDLFELLDQAYIRARYDPRYKIFKDQLEYLAPRVKRLLDRTEKICKARIQHGAPPDDPYPHQPHRAPMDDDHDEFSDTWP